jgi:hypothetical protein
MTTITNEQLAQLNTLFDYGLCSGIGTGKEGEVCVMAAINAVITGDPHSDGDAECVSSAVRSFQIRLNDAAWPSKKERADGMRALAIESIGTKGVLDDVRWTRRVAELFIREQLPDTLRTVAELFKDKPHHAKLTEAAQRCEDEGSSDAADAAADAADAAADAAAAVASARWAAVASARWAAAARWAADAVDAAAAAAAVDAAAVARWAADDDDAARTRILTRCAGFGLRALREQVPS